MLDIVANAIDQFYRKKDYASFVKYCKQDLELHDELKQYMNQKKLNVSCSSSSNAPSKTWYIRFNDYEKGEFKVSYKTILEVSKVVPAFYIQHEFEVENKDENRMEPYLDGYSLQPYSKSQFELAEYITAFLAEKGYQELDYRDINEVVEGFKMPEGVTIFGPQITVEHLLFKDVLRICSDE